MRQHAKVFLQKKLLSQGPAFVVGSIGRSGSTLVYDALIQSQIRKTPPPIRRVHDRIIREWSWNLGEKTLQSGCVYKTHDYPEALAEESNVKSVFLFGSAVEAALSVHSAFERFGREWVQEHFQHLNVDSPASEEALFSGDTLHFYNQMRRWAQFTGAPVLCLRYEALWDNVDRLSEFCNRDIRLPPQKPRQAKTHASEVTDMAQAAYGYIDTALTNLPDAFESGSHMAEYFRQA